MIWSWARGKALAQKILYPTGRRGAGSSSLQATRAIDIRRLPRYHLNRLTRQNTRRLMTAILDIHSPCARTHPRIPVIPHFRPRRRPISSIQETYIQLLVILGSLLEPNRLIHLTKFAQCSSLPHLSASLLSKCAPRAVTAIFVSTALYLIPPPLVHVYLDCLRISRDVLSSTIRPAPSSLQNHFWELVSLSPENRK